MITSQGGNSPQKRVEALDLLRALAVTAVLLFHYGFRGPATGDVTGLYFPGLSSFSQYGYIGVQMFFVISGFVIAYSAEGRTALRFAIARAARIYPCFVLCMTLTFAVMLAFGAPRFGTNWLQWLANLLIAAPAVQQPFMDGAYWSIVYEIVFYAWVFLLILTGQFKRQIDLILACWLFISIFNETVLHSKLVLRLFLTDQSAFFCAGLALYEIFCGRRDRKIMSLLALSTLVALSQSFVAGDRLREQYHTEVNDFVIVGTCLASIALVGLCAYVRRLPLPSQVVMGIGGLTYPLYLLHQNIGYILLNRLNALSLGWGTIILTMLLMASAAFLVWRIVDKPAQRWATRLLTSIADRAGIINAPWVRLGVNASLPVRLSPRSKSTPAPSSLDT